MSQRHPFSTVSCFRRFASRDKISHYFDRFICQRLYYDAEIAWMISRNMSPLNVRTTYKVNTKILTSWYDLNMYIINVIADDETQIGLYEIYFFND
jgi:hypothetical protein